MTLSASFGFPLLLLVTIVAQALWPAHRLLIVLAGAAGSCVAASVLGVASASALFAAVPWNVLLILVCLGLFAERLAATRLFGLASVKVTRLARARPQALMVLFGIGTYLVSGVVNNLTALLVVLPVLLTVFALVGVTQRYAQWTLGLLLVLCNLGGAATPIGDFPAVLLLARGAMGFDAYLAGAVLPTAVAVVLLLAVVGLWVQPARDVPFSALGQRLTLTTLAHLYRGVRLDWRLLGPCLLALAAMLLGWLAAPESWGLTPELVAWIGAGAALLARPSEGEAALRRSVDVEAVLFLMALFLMVGAVRETGLFVQATQLLTTLELSPTWQVVLFLVAAAVLTGLFSAGPSMAALLDVAEALAKQHPPEAIYIGLALAVCAGSSLFLTAATSGPLTQALVERSGLRDAHGVPVTFGFREFLPVGLLGFTVILTVAVARTLWVLG
jgi:Na+/H+ antiporter NhaD/arsenite permease-like protein